MVGFGFCVLAGAILSLPGGGRAAGICAAILGALFVLLLMLFRPDFGVRPTTPLALLVVLAWFAGLGLGALAILSGLYRVADSKPAKPPR